MTCFQLAKYMRAFAAAWARREIVQAPLAQLPWYHHLALLECLKSRNDIVAEYSLADLDRPIGVSTYRLGLPSLEELQVRLRRALAAPGRKRAT